MSDVLIVGAGPAGMSAALDLQAYGLAVTIVDDQPAPGGRIFAAIESRKAHGSDDHMGAELVARFRASGGTYLPQTEVWQIEPGPRVFVSRRGRASMLEPRYVLLGSGAQERPMPFPGWQLPGVMTVGAAQILLKTAREVPDRPVWLAGSGPLLLLYAHQLIAAGGKVAGILDCTAPWRTVASGRLVPGALMYGWRDLVRGLAWKLELLGTRVIRGVTEIEAHGTERVERVRYRTRRGAEGEIDTTLLLVHDGVVPSVHNTLAAGCDHRWNAQQQCFEPVVDQFGRSSEPAVFVAGDGATIAGARAAISSGQLAAVGIARAAGKLTDGEAEHIAAPIRRKLAAAAGFRRLIDSMFPPSDVPLADATLVCRCEEVTAGELRNALRGRTQLGPDGLKSATRAGMGPCQGRQCGLSLTRLVAEMHGAAPGDVGFLRIRPPLKPLTIVELAALETEA